MDTKRAAAGTESSPPLQPRFGNNIRPSVRIISPAPSYLPTTYVTPNVCVTWAGSDSDGVFTNDPVKYKYTLLTTSTPVTIDEAIYNPSAIAQYYAPIAWAGWDSTSSDTTFARLLGLPPNTDQLFVVTAFDEAGDYDSTFTLTENMLRLRVLVAATSGPVITMASTNFSYTYNSGGWFDSPQRTANVEMPWGVPLTFNFFAQPLEGNDIICYRWVLDPSNLLDQTPRSDEMTDLHHWSQCSLSATQVTLGPFVRPGFKREEHKLYIEARSGPGGCAIDSSYFTSLGIIHFVVVRPTASRELLIVDDTRLTGDGSTCPLHLTGNWPNAAELDTFLYARGNVPWTCMNTNSKPGIFAGYDFDTLGTRYLLSGLQQNLPNPSQDHTIPLSLLADYRHVIWITDFNSANNGNSFSNSSSPMTALRFLSQARQANVLSTYAAMGGKVWMTGGGTIAATLLPWNKTANDSPFPRFSVDPPYLEIAPGRMPWEQLHLRSEVTLNTAATAPRSLGRFTSSPGVYATVPAALETKTAATDSLPPLRTGGQFYIGSHRVEYVSQPNYIVEDVDPDPDIFDEQSVLDTLFTVVGGGVPNDGIVKPAMTLYHGAENGQVLWSGFDIWTFRRTECIALVDWVLHDLWGLARAPISRQPSEAGASAARSRRSAGE